MYYSTHTTSTWFTFFLFACVGGVQITHQIGSNDVLHNGMKLVKNRRILTQMFFWRHWNWRKTLKLIKLCEKKSFEKNVKPYKFHLKEIWLWCMIIAMITTKKYRFVSGKKWHWTYHKWNCWIYFDNIWWIKIEFIKPFYEM